MSLDYLDFEQPIVELDGKIDALRQLGNHPDLDIEHEIEQLMLKRHRLIESSFNQLSPKQIVALARHPLRPHTLDFISQIFDDFQELHGDRHGAKGAAMIGGFAQLNGAPVMVIGQQKGRTTKEKCARNFGMTAPEGFRKALRLMKLAEKFSLPVLTFIDTPGAYPGVEAEQHNQSEAIARNLFEMAQLKTPIICTIIGEGCSGGALAIGVGDVTMMLQYSYYSVISPEGCASILWKSAERASDAAHELGLTADRLKQFGLIDTIIDEPPGGAHRDPLLTSDAIKSHLLTELDRLQAMPLDDLLTRRLDRWRRYGVD